MHDFVNVDTDLFSTNQEWEDTIKKYWKTSPYHEYRISIRPKSYPCIAISVSTPRGELGMFTEIIKFIYPTDFAT